VKNCCDLVFVTVVQFSYGGDCGGRNSLLRRRELEERERKVIMLLMMCNLMNGDSDTLQ
jgi:predicted metal-binding protein